MKCPLCLSTQIGRIGPKRYYCHRCYHEWSEKTKQIQVFRILEDGTALLFSIKSKSASA